MLERAKEVIKEVAKNTDSVMLMHSMTGKDSIVLLDLLYPHFKRVACLFEYTVKDLRHIAIYADYAKRKYPNIELYQVPHYVVFTHIKYGYLGIEKDPTQKLWKFSDLIRKVGEHIGIEWACVGFKQSDSFNRRLTLRIYKDGMEAIDWKTKKFYPLSTYKNKDIVNYIAENRLKKNECYGAGQSSGCAIDDYDYMKFLQNKFPDDYERVIRVYPKSNFVVKLHEEDRDQREAGNQPW
ncbi:MAG: phosphoadenosine phosphosulfate reductase family protein [Bacteroidales bacterium]|nr:phosphoadenosine phosphosulfate reductase family protein [Bacteroidales bacterium]